MENFPNFNVILIPNMKTRRTTISYNRIEISSPQCTEISSENTSAPCLHLIQIFQSQFFSIILFLLIFTLNADDIFWFIAFNFNSVRLGAKINCSLSTFETERFRFHLVDVAICDRFILFFSIHCRSMKTSYFSVDVMVNFIKC